MAMDTSQAPGPSNTSREPSELEKLRFDYAWKWFCFHAEQRTKMFNFMLIGLGVFASGLVTAIEKHLRLESAVLASAATLIAVGFFLLDRRNKQLYQVALAVLIETERTLLFPDATGAENAEAPGISRRIQLEEKNDPKGWKGAGIAIRQGRHRVMMPLVTAVFVLLFATTAIWSWRTWWLLRDTVDTPAAACCQPVVVLRGDEGAGRTALLSPQTASGPASDTVAIDGTGSVGGRHWWLLVVGLVIAAGGAAAFVTGRKLGGSIAVAAGLATSVLPNLSVPLKGEFHFDPKVEAKLADRFEFRIERLLDIARRSEPALLATGRFGGLGEGIERFDCEDAANRKSIDEVNIGIARARERQQQVVVLLIGGTDRQPLSAALRRRFESNTGLARA